MTDRESISRNSRERILRGLRAGHIPFDDAPPRPATYLPVTPLADDDLLARFKAEVERLTGHVHLPGDTHAAIDTVLSIIRDDKTVIAWQNLPMPELLPVLEALSITVVVPQARYEARRDALEAAEPIRVGITGADAAFATTGTLALVTGEGQGRLPSLLPPVHIALLQRWRLVPRLEDWIATAGRDALAQSASVALVTGPSRTGDIEMKTILGVHGPGVIHVVVLP